MGLDTYAAPSPDGELGSEDLKAFVEADLQLAGGFWSGDPGSFRGKVYATVVERVSGISLYEEWIPTETVRAMASAFARCDPEAVARDLAAEGVETTESEIRSLGTFFSICADRGLGLVCWS